MGADCKSVGLRLHRFESCTCHHQNLQVRGVLVALRKCAALRPTQLCSVGEVMGFPSGTPWRACRFLSQKDGNNAESYPLVTVPDPRHRLTCDEVATSSYRSRSLGLGDDRRTAGTFTATVTSIAR